MGDKRSAFQSFKRVVVKVGTSSVAYDTGKPIFTGLKAWSGKYLTSITWAKK